MAPQVDKVERQEAEAPAVIKKAAPKKKVAPKKKATVNAEAKAASIDKVIIKKAPSKKSSLGGRRGIRLKDDSDN